MINTPTTIEGLEQLSDAELSARAKAAKNDVGNIMREMVRGAIERGGNSSFLIRKKDAERKLDAISREIRRRQRALKKTGE